MVSEQFRSKRRTPTGGSLKQRFISFHPPIGFANGLAFFTMDQLQYRVTTSSERHGCRSQLTSTRSRKNGFSTKSEADLLPEPLSFLLRLADRPRRFLRTTSTKTTALGCVGTLVILHQEWFSGCAFQTLFRHLRYIGTCAFQSIAFLRPTS